MRLILPALLLAACRRGDEPAAPATAAVPPPAQVRLQLDWYPQAEHGGFFQALARGFYAEAGLEVELLSGGPGPRTGARVVSGAAELGIHRSDDIITHAAEGLPFVIVGAFMQHDPQALLLHAESPVSSFADLDGRAIMAVPGSNWLRYLQQRYRIQFRLIPHSWGLAQFMADRDFIQQCFITNEPYIVQRQGVPARTLLIAGSGYDPYRVVFTTRRFLERQPAEVRAFVAASTRGWTDYVEGDPAPAHRLILARNDQLTPELLAYSHAAMREHRLVSGDPAQGESVGALDPKRLQDQVRLLVELGIVRANLPLESVVAPEFLSAPEPRSAK